MSIDVSSLKIPRKTVMIYAENFGCAANKFDLEVMLGQLAAAGYGLTDDINSADLILVNTCAVKKPTEDRVIERLRSLRRLGKPLIIAGCLPRINFNAVLNAVPDFSAALDPRSVNKIVSAVKAALNGEKRRIFRSDSPLLKLELPRVRLNPVIEIIAICEGCSGACTFCCVRFARGSSYSCPREAICENVSRAVSNGAKEIWLTSQDNGSYGMDIGTNLAELLGDCCKVKGRFKIRVGMMNPNRVIPMLDELVDAYKHGKIFKFLHVPVQSGDNEILKRMNRRYTAEQFKHIVEVFRKNVPDITISTDVICGFPGETQDAFEKTLRLIEEVQPDIVNISRFFSRPGTPAEKMEQVDYREIRDRSRRTTFLVRQISLKRNKRWLGWKGEILIDEKGKDGSWIGRNFAYKPIVVKSARNLLGKFLEVRVTKVFSTYLEAEIVEQIA